MTGGLIALVIVVLLPLFVATWRASLLGLLLQGVLIAWLSLRGEPKSTVELALIAIDLVVLRAIAAPALLYAAMRRLNVPARNDVIAPNLFSWTLVVGLVVAAFRVADALVPAEGEERTLVAVSAVAFALGLFVLAMARGTFSEIVGVLRIENAIALFELGGPGEHAPAAIHAVTTALLGVSIVFYRWYLVRLTDESSIDPRASTISL